MPEFFQICEGAARAGAEQLEAYRHRFRTTSKGHNDLVTDADFASQRAVHDYLAGHYPEHGFVGEERLDLPMSANADSDWQWIVDPLDGTMNYVHQLPSWSVSVALRRKGKVIAGAVYDPCMDEMYSAGESANATLNGQPIEASGCETPRDALMIVSLPPKLVPDSPEIADLIKLLCSARSVRRLGSAALNLCYVAAGRVDGYWATSLNLWDVAAGWLIVERSGAVVRHVNGGEFDPDDPRLIAVATEELGRQIVQILADRDS